MVRDLVNLGLLEDQNGRLAVTDYGREKLGR